ncbi:MAG: GNAT family N-acetyltransferase [Symbiobacteriaceae bacterium]|nr:GNAT family N-acetyltransferase [Symbiobacteriaceae bacterium]
MSEIFHRAIEPNDAVHLYKWLSVANNNISSFYLSQHIIRKSLEAGSYNSDPNCYLVFETNNQPIGLGMITSIDRSRRNCEITVTVNDVTDNEYEIERIIAYELLRICFEEFSMHRVYTCTYENVLDRENLWRSLGAVLEVTERQGVFRMGRFWDKSIFSVLITEWIGSQVTSEATNE